MLTRPEPAYARNPSPRSISSRMVFWPKQNDPFRSATKRLNSAWALISISCDSELLRGMKNDSALRIARVLVHRRVFERERHKMLLDDGRQSFQSSRELPIRNVGLRSEMAFRKHPDRCEVLGNLLWCILGWDSSNPELVLEIARHCWSLKRAKGKEWVETRYRQRRRG